MGTSSTPPVQATHPSDGTPDARPDAAPDEPEVVLEGGFSNRGLVTRKGDTVRRPQRPTSRATHALLRHLADVGFEGAPRFLRIDKRGREVCSYFPGRTASVPLQAWATTEKVLLSVARLLRDFHDAVESFDPSPYTWPMPAPREFRTGTTMISHNDPCPDNVVFRDGAAVALIDFDLASPGSRMWDVACAARLWAPLRADDDLSSPLRGHTLPRLRRFVDAYGLSESERALLPRAVIEAHAWSYDHVRTAVARGHPGFVPYWRGGGAARAERTMRWLVEHEQDVADALLR